MLTLTEVLTHFHGVHRRGKDYRAVCPVHGDSPAHPSLSISDGNHALLFKCETKGCAVADILSAASPPLVWGDVLPESNGRSPVLIYTATFVNEQGQPVYESLRFHPKDFKVRAASGAWSIAGLRRMLYRYPELVGQKVLWYVEGPQKADALWRLGIPATCHVGGAKGWLPFSTEYLRQWKALGADVIGCPDQDTAGLEMIGQVVAGVTGLGYRAKVVQLPGLSAKGDILDWLRAGGTKAQLETLRRETPIWVRPVEQPRDTFERVGLNTYRWCLPEGIRFELDYVRRDHHELHGELGVYTTIPHAKVIDDDVLHIASFNASSLPAREKLAGSLTRRAGTKDEVDWLGLLERFCRKVAQAERSQLEVLTLSEAAPAPEGDEAMWMIGELPILKQHPVLLYGDGGTLKSHVLLHVAGRLTYEGVRVLYTDFEFRAGDHRLRLGRLFPDPLPMFRYVHCHGSIFDYARQLARIIHEERIELLIVDSVGAAAEAPNFSLNDSLTANTYYNTIERIAPGLPSIHSAHVSRQALEQGKADIPKKPFGSAFWSFRARASWYVKKQSESRNPVELAFYHTKASTGPLLDPFGLAIEFLPSSTTLTSMPVRTTESGGRLSTIERIRTHAAGKAASYVEIAKAVGESVETVRRTMGRYKDEFTHSTGEDGVQRHQWGTFCV